MSIRIETFIRMDMIDIKRLDLASLNASQLRSYEELTLPKFQDCLHSKHIISNTDSIAVIASEDDEPVGMVLASLYKALKIAEIHSIKVKEKYRGHQIEESLLRIMQDELFKEGCMLVTFLYSAEDSSAPNLERIFKKQGWPDSRIYIIKCTFDGRTFDPNWLKQEYHYLEGYEVFPWSELIVDERSRLIRQMEQGVIQQVVNPFQEEDLLEPLNSLGLRYKGDVVGWMLTHRIAPDTIRYTSLYIQRHLHLRGPAIFLLCESIKRQIASDVPWAVLEVNVMHTEMSWLIFLKRRLMPHAVSVENIMQAWKQLD
jgi:hypothetical protein